LLQAGKDDDVKAAAKAEAEAAGNHLQENGGQGRADDR
jgi:hypothetical protein